MAQVLVPRLHLPYQHPFGHHIDNHIRYEVIPCTEKIENVLCPCGQLHYLFSDKEPLVYFQEKVWSRDCAIKELRTMVIHWKTQYEELSKQTGELIRDRIDLLNSIAENKRQLGNRIQHLEKKRASWKNKFKKYAYHLDSCDIITDASCGRVIESKCTCGLQHTLDSITENPDDVEES